MSQGKPPADDLALLGGSPVRAAPWPAWPVVNQRTLRRLEDVIASGRWTLTNPSPRTPLQERAFARRFADLYQVAHCVPTSSGSAAIKLALLAVGVRPLDRVLIPGLTWAAVGSAVANVCAVPVPVDVARDSLCMSALALAEELDRAPVQPRAIIVTHQNCAVADITGLMAVASRRDIPLIEDCSQAHGATIAGRPVGSFGAAAVFSFQQNKLLTCGEGGAVITSDEVLYGRLQQLRSVGREFDPDQAAEGGLREVGEVIGDSVVLSEFQAALLLDQLDRFPEQHERRLACVRYLEERLQGRPWLEPVVASPPGTIRGYHKYVWRLDRAQLHGVSARSFALALAKELGREIGLVDPSFELDHLIGSDALLQRITPRGFDLTADELMPSRRLPVAAAARAECFHLRHDAFLSSNADMDQVADAIDKVHRHAERLAHWAQG